MAVDSVDGGAPSRAATERQTLRILSAALLGPGRWRVTRSIADALAGETLRFEGVLVVEEAGQGVARHQESGWMTREDGARLRAEQTRLWRAPEPGALDIAYADGAHLARFAPGAGAEDGHIVEGFRLRGVHHCGADLYEGVLWLGSPDAWELQWRVAGPRKRYVSDSRYDRAAYHRRD